MPVAGPHQLEDGTVCPPHEADPGKLKVALPPPKAVVNPLADSESSPPPIHILAHSKEAQELFDAIPLSWGVQYEIARGVSQGAWSWETVVQSESALRSLRGPNANASRVSQVLGRPLEDPLSADDAVWSELDREDAAIAEGRGRGLGLQGDFMGERNWYGGNVQQAAVLREEGNRDGGFRLVLAKMEMGKSNRFARFLGSRRMLQVSILHSIVSGRADELRAFFGRKFVLCGRVYVAFCVKGTRVFLMETPEDYERVAVASGDDRRITLMDFVVWHNPIELNSSQLMSEWLSSFDLGFSSSIPVLSILPENVHQISDKVAPLDDPDMAPPAEYIYTDGCGWMNTAALSLIARHMGLEERPTAVEGRFGGAAGLWVLHLDDHSSTPQIWIRDSQVKIKLDVENPHPAHSIFELLGVSRVTPGRLSRLVIMNLAHNGVPKETFVEFMKGMIDEEVKPLMQWSGPQAMLRLSEVVEGLKICRGWMNYDRPNWPSTSTTHWEARRTIHNDVVDLLQAGFHPLTLGHLFEKLKKMVRFGLDNIISDLHLSIYRCARAFIVPDPYGVLREGEIHFKSTELLNGVEDLNQYLLLGDVLIYRDPCILPSDVQKVKAVQCEALSAYTDVIVVPTVGPRSFASYLSEDYDGATVIYEDRLVKDFRTAASTVQSRNFVSENFKEGDLTQQATVGQLAAHSRIVEMSLLSNLGNTPPISLYHQFHECSAYAHGYDSPETIRLALVFKALLVSQKTGRFVKKKVFKRDKQQFSKQLPPSLQTASDNAQQWRDRRFKRDPALGQFVLDHLFDAGQKMRNEQMKRYDGIKPRVFHSDADLLRPWEKVKPWIGDSSSEPPGVAADLALIQAHVDTYIKEWRAIAQRTSSNKSTRSGRGKGGGARNAAAKSVQAHYDELAQSYAYGPEFSPGSLLASVANIEQLKASYAYTKKPTFAWIVAFQTLCQMKKGASQGSLEMTTDLPDA
ncbi:RNA-dependent RNA polymerase [Ganoderma sinense ZZ0214-1]|uniref:RNA-dependent RNA polymerase n=1 Tax=Ganoderma sinense ZZ0214-1 TaxID=1077348 RepID=A0A2G8SBN0_9APHY|nr:RNA-dependent RNA polymerase [Ganoderma sinense ZZ0214-1]